VYGAIVHLMQGDAPPVHAVNSLKTQTPARLEPGLAGHGCPPLLRYNKQAYPVSSQNTCATHRLSGLATDIARAK